MKKATDNKNDDDDDVMELGNDSSSSEEEEGAEDDDDLFSTGDASSPKKSNVPKEPFNNKNKKSKLNLKTRPKNGDDEDEEGGEDDDDELFSTGDGPDDEEDDDEEEEPVNKRSKKNPKKDKGSYGDDQKITKQRQRQQGGGGSGGVDGGSGGVDPALLEHAKQRMSKWAARLFDPDRPRGLVQAPQVIPLNDEFLKAFGKREKEFDQATGKIVNIESAIESSSEEEEDDLFGSDNNNNKEESSAAKQIPVLSNNKALAATQVKITNLAYKTQASTLQSACEKYGPIVEVKLILDKDRQSGPNVFNSGRAYVTFDHVESAQECVDGLKELDGRLLRLSLVAEKPKRSTSGGANNKNTSQSLLNRYWEKDISTVCYRCGEVGHLESNCTNPAKPRPCPLCGFTDHEEKLCPCKKVCFNCGIPGHINRECNQPRGLPRRVVCSICFMGGHHRMQCRNYRGAGYTRDAVCMLCGQVGHFLCRELKWYFGLSGISCFNCGSQGHSGYNCDRPTLFQLNQDPDLTNQEIQRAEANSIAEQLEQAREQQQQQQRGRAMGRETSTDESNSRHRSLPPQKQRGQQNGERRNSGGGERRPGGSDPRKRGRGYK